MIGTVEKQMDKAIKNKDFERFIAYFEQYNMQSSNIVFYKTIVMLYFLSNNEFDKYYSMIQGCLKHEDDYFYVIKVCEAMNVCDIVAIDELLEQADSAYKCLVEKIKINIQEMYKIKMSTEYNSTYNDLVTENSIRNDIKDHIFILNNFKK